MVALDHTTDLVGHQPPVSRLPAQDAQQRFLTDNYVVLDGLWNVELAEALQTEATAMRAVAGPPSDGPVIRVGGTRTSQRPALMTRPGPVRAELHGSLTRFLRALSARMLVPSQGTYTYYELDEEVRLHVDTPACDVTLITEVLGNRHTPLPLPPWADRAKRARANMLENFPHFAAFVLTAHLAGASNHYTALGATIFFWARLAHALLYITGIWQPRAIAYFAGVAGEILIVAQLIRT